LRHLLEQKKNNAPSLRTYIMPVPAGKSFPQKEQRRGLGNDGHLFFD
jgi:hypothetical protein